MEPEIPVFDRKGLMKRLMDDESFARAVVSRFLQEFPKQIEALELCLEVGDVAGVEHQIHTMKGTAANVGGEALRALAYELEKTAKLGSLKSVDARVPELEMQFERLKEAMEQSFPGM